MADPKQPHQLSELFDNEDLVDAIFEACWQIIKSETSRQPEDIKQALRDRYAGSELYLRKRRTRAETAKEVLARFNGRNATEICRELGISRATVYRLLKQPGTPR